MGRGFTWLDAGTHESLFDATIFVKTMESHQHRKIGCLEEIAYDHKWIDRHVLEEKCKDADNNQYSKYLKDVLDGNYQADKFIVKK